MISVPRGAVWCAEDAAVDARAGVAVSARAAAGTASSASDLRMDMGFSFSLPFASAFRADPGGSAPARGRTEYPLDSRVPALRGRMAPQARQRAAVIASGTRP